MPLLSALLHASDDALRIGRAVESLRPCDEVLVIDHGSTDATARVARDYGATVLAATPGADPAAHARHYWILCLLPNEALTEALEASLHEWKRSDPGDAPGFALSLREEAGDGWRQLPPQLRLVHRRRITWTGPLPPNQPAPLLAGDLLRFARP